MPFVNYKNSNNASSKLLADISASATTILITDGDQALFPSEFPFLLTLEHHDSEGNVILREIVKATAGNQNSFVVVRGAGTCVQDDTAAARVQGNDPHSFYSGDSVSLYRTAEQVKDIQDKLATSINATSIAEEYDNTKTYIIGDVVMFEGDRYVCNTDVSTAEDFDSSKWTKTAVQTNLSNIEGVIEQIEPVAPLLSSLQMIDIIAVGGGGAGGSGGQSSGGGFGGGGGGGGEVIAGKYLGTSKSYDVVIGLGGQYQTGNSCLNCFPGYRFGCNGGDTKFGQLTAHGGHGGLLNVNENRADGGVSGGGYSSAKATSSYCSGPGGSGAGGSGCYCSSNQRIGGDGGPGKCGFGGGGGGGAFLIGSCHGGTGSDGGGCGGCCGHYSGYDATNYGGGGGGGAGCQGAIGVGGAGCQGIVIVKYPTDGSGGICCATGGTITTETIDDVEYCVHTFTSDGTFCIVC